MKLGFALIVVATSTSCLAASGSLMAGPTLALFYPPGGVPKDKSAVGDEAKARLAARPHKALAVATRDALDAAAAAPQDSRLQRRAAAMVRALVRDADARAQLADVTTQTTRLLERLVATAPCPGLADAAATWAALDQPARAGDAYVQAARRCESVDAAIASVGPLRSVERCDDALATLRAAWPRAQGKQGIAVLDGVARCSDEISLRRNLSFAPADVVEDYFALLAERAAQAEAAERRAEQYRREEAVRAASSRCESECSSAESSCISSCRGDSPCGDRCSALYHSCRSGC